MSENVMLMIVLQSSYKCWYHLDHQKKQNKTKQKQTQKQKLIHCTLDISTYSASHFSSKPVKT